MVNKPEEAVPDLVLERALLHLHRDKVHAKDQVGRGAV